MRPWHLAIVVALPQGLAAEVDAFRAGLGDATLGRVPAHLTIVPPVTVRDDDLTEALALARTAAAGIEPFAVHLGPVTTFAPVTPTLHLAVEDPSGRLARLRETVFRGPWQRKALPFVGHVTLLPHAPQHLIGAARLTLRHYRRELPIDRLSVMVEGRFDDGEGHRRRWAVLADTDLDGCRVVGRGGLPLELSTGTVIDPEVARALGGVDPRLAEGPLPTDLVVVARREGHIVGAGWRAREQAAAGPDANGPTTERFDLAVIAEARGQGVGRHLRAELAFRSAQRAARVPLSR